MFTYGGKQHTNRVEPLALNCEKLRKGDHITEYIGPANPEVNTVLSPENAYRKYSGGYIPEWGWPIFGPILFLLFQFYPRRNSSNKRNAE